MKSLSDFKAKFIDCYHLQDIHKLQSGLERLSWIGSITSDSPRSANVIDDMFNSIGFRKQLTSGRMHSLERTLNHISRC